MIGTQQILNADIYWTLPEDIEAETFSWISSDPSVIEIVSTTSNGQNANIDIKKWAKGGSFEIELNAPLHGLSKTFRPYVDNDILYDGDIGSDSYNIVISTDKTKAYVADKDDGLLIIDITNLASPAIVGYYHVLGMGHGTRKAILFDDETKAYAANSKQGLVIFDLENYFIPIPIN